MNEGKEREGRKERTDDGDDDYRGVQYQETDCVFLTVFVRGVDHDSVTVKVESTQVLIDGKMEDGEPLHVVFGPLFEEIETTGWTVTKRARKIEVMVMKKEKLTWADLTAQTGKEGVGKTKREGGGKCPYHR
eukprot:TRINITY_DN2263_c0_g3_i6.p2 TRINITY_DN2263_c0_g3~~TRINITY_DN2263_c0_g3_i6.p2  ORF type:complete len:132 (+),score=43.97 TRINITY_DN2263_c0_g3_i6:375-770(+)